MASQAPRGPVDLAHPTDAAVRVELARILSSEFFSRSDRLTTFLKFIVEHTLDGHGEALKEQVLALEVYGKGVDFNTAADPIVRVDARRLRDKLREYTSPLLTIRSSSPFVRAATHRCSKRTRRLRRSSTTAAIPHSVFPQTSTVVTPRRWSRAWLLGAGSILVGAIALIAWAFCVVHDQTRRRCVS